jgi:hypothetical protein
MVENTIYFFLQLFIFSVFFLFSYLFYFILQAHSASVYEFCFYNRSLKKSFASFFLFEAESTPSTRVTLHVFQRPCFVVVVKSVGLPFQREKLCHRQRTRLECVAVTFESKNQWLAPYQLAWLIRATNAASIKRY